MTLRQTAGRDRQARPGQGHSRLRRFPARISTWRWPATISCGSSIPAGTASRATRPRGPGGLLGRVGRADRPLLRLLQSGQHRHPARRPRFVTAEKGIPRVKVYEADGTFFGVVAGPETFAPTLTIARGDAGRPPAAGPGRGRRQPRPGPGARPGGRQDPGFRGEETEGPNEAGVTLALTTDAVTVARRLGRDTLPQGEDRRSVGRD